MRVRISLCKHELKFGGISKFMQNLQTFSIVFAYWHYFLSGSIVFHVKWAGLVRTSGGFLLKLFLAPQENVMILNMKLLNWKFMSLLRSDEELSLECAEITEELRSKERPHLDFPPLRHSKNQ